jgi:hypothetical protein
MGQKSVGSQMSHLNWGLITGIVLGLLFWGGLFAWVWG